MTKNSNPQKNRAEQLELLEPDKNLSRRKLQRYEKNPFIDDDFLNQMAGRKNVFFTQTTPATLIDMQTQEVTPVKTQIVKTVKADKEQFVKIFTTHLKAFFELNQTAYKILQYVLHTVQKEAMNSDEVHLNLLKAQKYFSDIGQTCSSASYYKGMKELVEKLFLAETTSQNIYFINPKLFFNGDRVTFMTNFEVEEPQTLPRHMKAIARRKADEEKDEGTDEE